MFSILSLLKKVNDVLFAEMDDMLSINLEFSHHNGGKKIKQKRYKA